MRTTSLVAAAVCALLLLFAGNGAAQESVSIFNGRDLDGWTIHGTELWNVEDGELI